MSNKKQTAPKELWADNEMLQKLNDSWFISDISIQQRNNTSKYLSETHVFEILDAKDKQIDGQRRVVQSFKDRYYEQIELIDSKNKELEYKDKEIERLKLEIARLSENNAKQELNVYTQFIAGEDAEIHNFTYYDFINKGQIQHECKGSVKAGHTYQVIQEGDKLRLEDITPIEKLLKDQ